MAAAAAPLVQETGAVPAQRAGEVPEGGSQTGRDDDTEDLGRDSGWQTGSRRQNKGTGKSHIQERNSEQPFQYEQREGDWRSKSRGCEDFMNFKRRTHCMKCKRDKNGEMT